MSFSSPELQSQVDMIFQMFDKDRSGFLQATELREYFGYLGLNLSRRETDEILKCIDANRDGAISREELLRGLTNATAFKMQKDPALQYEQTVTSIQVHHQLHTAQNPFNRSYVTSLQPPNGRY